jgi:glycosyltransferase involved in cell wall biosynthesis
MDVAILMCTYNGSTYLREQLESFANQSHKNWTLYVSDDGSADTTLSILAEYQRRWGEHRLIIFEGPRQGFGKNFMSLLRRSEVKGHYYAFSDQDDVWFSDKLERSISRLCSLSLQIPSLYCSRTRLIDACGNVTGKSPLFSRPPSFQNALVQSLAGANTMTINQAARVVLSRLPADATIIAHDWLAYILITACGGVAIYDSEPTLDYRQHSGNLIGANASFVDQIIRFRKMFSGRFVAWNNVNVKILQDLSQLLTPENQTVLEHFDRGRRQRAVGRLIALRKSGVYRQTPRGNISLLIAACLGRI